MAKMGANVPQSLVHSTRASMPLSAFRDDKRGVVAVVFGVVALPAVALIGATVDYTRAATALSTLQGSVDSAAMASASRMLTNREEAEAYGISIGKANFARTSDQRSLADPTFQVAFDEESSAVTVSAKTELSTAFMGLIGIPAIDITATGTAVAGIQSLEVAVVVDTSHSMEMDMNALQTGLRDFADVLEEIQKTGEVDVSLVPFSLAVNVGPENADADWMDAKGHSPIHYQDFDETVTRFELLDEMKIEWAGCVMARPGLYELSVGAPDRKKPESLFVPMFAPDEPGEPNELDVNPLDGVRYMNTYLPDDSGTCGSRLSRAGGSADRPAGDKNKGTSKGKGKKKGHSKKNTKETGPAGILRTAQNSVCKYRGARPTLSKSWADTSHGPNLLCDTQPITPLTDDLGTFRADVDTLRADGGTNAIEGFMWGWRTLAPNEPFAGAKPLSDRANRKVIIMMADGENNIVPTDEYVPYEGINWSSYSPYGYLSHGALLADRPESMEEVTAALNTRFLKACDAAKAADIDLWMVAFDLKEEAARKTLEACASNPEQFIVARTQADLKSVFPAIAERLSTVRLTH